MKLNASSAGKVPVHALSAQESSAKAFSGGCLGSGEACSADASPSSMGRRGVLVASSAMAKRMVELPSRGEVMGCDGKTGESTVEG